MTGTHSCQALLCSCEAQGVPALPPHLSCYRQSSSRQAATSFLEPPGRGRSGIWFLRSGDWTPSCLIVGWAPYSSLLLFSLLSDSTTNAPEWPGSLPYCLLLLGVFRICHCHRDHTLQQMAGPEPETLLLSCCRQSLYGVYHKVWV